MERTQEIQMAFDSFKANVKSKPEFAEGYVEFFRHHLINALCADEGVLKDFEALVKETLSARPGEGGMDV